MRILVVEDDPLLRSGLVDLLEGAGHAVELATDGLTAALRGRDSSVDAILLDLALPKLDGVEVCRRVRRARPDVPILMLTARGAEDDKVRGLKAGADDYVTKPFSAKELLARLEALDRRRRGAPAEPEVIELDGLRLDLGRCEARRGNRTQALTPREVGILRWLHRHRERAVTRAELLEHVWGIRAPIETRTVDMAIAHLRRKVERDPSRPRLVRSVKGVGYAWGAS
jgi:DNA-binding response OmpR family regulator